MQSGRYAAAGPAIAAEGWTIDRLVPPSRLYGANGLRTGRDGRIYVAQVGGSQVSAIDPDSGVIETISPIGGGIVAPDDLVFDDEGNLYLTEITEGRVSMLRPDGRTEVVYGDLPVANPITMHQGRLLAGQCVPGGSVVELSRDGGAPRTILADAPMPNAFAVGPDGKLYMPMMATNEIWRIGLDGGAHEVVAGDLGVPDSVKFDAQGFIVSTQVGSGQVLRIDPRSGARTVLADIMPGLDNCTFVGERLFVSSIPGGIFEILGDRRYKPLVDHGLQWPLGLATGADGALFVADGGLSYRLAPGGEGGLTLAGMFFTPGYPGYIRGVAACGDGGFMVTTGTGDVARFWPDRGENVFLAHGLGWLMGVALLADGAAVVASWDRGTVHSIGGDGAVTLAGGLDKPMGVAVGDDGTIYVAESGGGRVVRLAGDRFETVLDGLGEPQGLAWADGRLLIVDAGAKTLIEHAPGGATRTIASALPIGAPAGVTPRFLGPIGTLSGPLINFAGVTAAADGTIYLAGDGDGSVIALRQG